MDNISKHYSIREATLEDAKTIWQGIDSHRDYLKIWLPFVPALQKQEDEEAFIRHGELLASGEYVDINVYGLLNGEI